MRRRLLALGFVFLFGGVSLGRDAAEPQAQPQPDPAVTILSTGASILGEPIRYPTTGPARITAAIVTLAPGQKTSVHKHGVPLFAYILEGELTVDYAGYTKRTFHAGEAFLEGMDVAHFGVNSGKQTMRLLAVYMGAQGAQDVIPVH
ncbi:MAG: cupin domain-containing protein [Rhodoplanes sp.]